MDLLRKKRKGEDEEEALVTAEEITINAGEQEVAEEEVHEISDVNEELKKEHKEEE